MKNYNKDINDSQAQVHRQEFVVRAAIEIMAQRAKDVHSERISSHKHSIAVDAWELAMALLDDMPVKVKDGSL